MNAILVSVPPEVCARIANGEQTLLLMKRIPKLDAPYRVYMYETKGQFVKFIKGAHTSYGYGRGKVIGSFVGKHIDYCMLLEHDKPLSEAKFENSLHISDLKIYDQPKELGEFNGFKKCAACKVSGYEVSACIHDENCMIPVPLTRPFQSWGYVEELSE